jgi:hypothetical protein
MDLVEPSNLREPSPDWRDKFATGFNTPPPGGTDQSRNMMRGEL